ncbi:MAG: hypothetical protein U1G08_03805 [Verrucomicrobiota bacterium]
MNFLFSTLFMMQVLVASLLGFCIVATLLQLAPGAALNRRELAAVSVVTAVAVASAWAAWELKEGGTLSGAILELAGFWGMGALGLLLSASRARWNRPN